MEAVMIGGIKHVVVNEGQEETFLELFRTLKSEMTKHEPGNVYYDLYRSRKSARTYVVTERYRDEAAFRSHQTSAYGQPLFQQMRAIIAIEVEYYDSVD
jgi:quinol monooxygenase YgiN